MKSTIGFEKRIENKSLILIITIILITNIIIINEIKASEENLEWSVTLNFNEPGGSNNNLLFGEASDASDVQDSYDVPIPPPGIPPYIRPWFDSGLNEPYNSLFYDIKKYPDDSKIWDLFVQWVPSDYTSSNDITISWDIAEIISSGYESIVLYDYEKDIVLANMKSIDNYTYSSSAMINYHFQIICNITPTSSNNPPIANINSPKQGYVNQTITLDASNSYDSDGYIQYYRWDFTNDGKWDTSWIEESIIDYVYFLSGKYTIKLQIMDDGGATDTETKIISILSLKEGKILPIADANGPYYGKINQNITFDASNSYDPDGLILNYSWDFGDGYKSFSKKTNHSFTIRGTYFVTLLVIDNDGLVGEVSIEAYIFDNDSDNDGWGDDEEIKYGTDPNNSEDFPLDTDNDHIPDSIDDNDDNDGLSDKLEIKFGSDPKNKSDVLAININDAIHFLIDIDMDGKSDLFYNSRSGNTTYIEIKSNNKYLLDENGDGKWDYIYDYMYGTIEPYKYEKDSSFPFLQLISILFFILILLIVAGIFYKKRLK